MGVVANSGGLSAGLELCQGAFGPGGGAQLIERIERGSQLLPGVDAPPRPAEPLAVVEARSGSLEHVRRALVMAQRGFELRGERAVVLEKRTCACGASEGEGQALLLSAPRVFVADGLCFGDSAEADKRVHDVRGGRKIRVVDRQLLQEMGAFGEVRHRRLRVAEA